LYRFIYLYVNTSVNRMVIQLSFPVYLIFPFS